MPIFTAAGSPVIVAPPEMAPPDGAALEPAALLAADGAAELPAADPADVAAALDVDDELPDEQAASARAAAASPAMSFTLRARRTLIPSLFMTAGPGWEAGGRDCLLYTSDAADEEDSVDLGGRRIIKK